MVLSAERTALKRELEATAKKVVSASASRGDLDGIRADLEDLEEPDPPTPRRYTTNDTSIEKMAELLMDNPDGLLLYRDELTGWLRSLDKAGHEAARAFYLEAWNGDGSHEVDRIGRGSLFVKALCVSVLGGIQPGPLSSYVEGAFDDGESADGLLQRLQVLVYPDRGRFDPTDLSPDLDARDRAYKVFKELADLDVEEFVGRAPGEAEEVPYLNFDDGAQEVFNHLRRRDRRRRLPGGPREPLHEVPLAVRLAGPRLRGYRLRRRGGGSRGGDLQGERHAVLCVV
jgi:putative DNA primase/helicase